MQEEKGRLHHLEWGKNHWHQEESGCGSWSVLKTGYVDHPRRKKSPELCKRGDCEECRDPERACAMKASGQPTEENNRWL